MQADEFWAIIEEARAGEDPAEALAGTLSGLSFDDVVAFRRQFDVVTDAVHRWRVWGAAYLIGGGCSDDSFSDFKAGLVALGRDWFERVAADPDELAGHPTVLERPDDLFAEDFGCAAEEAAGVVGDEEDFWEALEAAPSGAAPDLGEGWDFDDAGEMRRRLPRLSELFLGRSRRG